MKIDITDTHFVELHKKGYNVDMVIMLGWINRNLSLEHIIKGSVKIKAIYEALKRKQLISEEGKITQIGIEILDFVSKKTNKRFLKPKISTSDFDEWWDIFPSTDIFTYKGKKFAGTRSLRVNKEKARLTFNKMLLEEKYTKEEIINATLYDVELKKNTSYQKGSNQLTFLQNSATYLNQEAFEPFIQFGKPKIGRETTNLGTLDI